MTVYISGKITGDANYKEKFERAEKALRETLDKSSCVVNPARFDLGERATWRDYMVYDIKKLLDCDTIFMLKGWQGSKGARVEKYIAEKLGFRVLYEGK